MCIYINIYITFDEYFLDETYRTDPNDFRPEILLQQWSLDPSDRA